MTVVPAALPPIAMERDVVPMLPIASTPVVANVVGDVEPLAITPASRPVAVIALAELTAAPAAPLSVAVAAIAAAAVAEARDRVRARVAANPIAPILAAVAFAAASIADPISIARAVPIADEAVATGFCIASRAALHRHDVAICARRIGIVAADAKSSTTQAVRAVRIVAAGQILSAALAHIQEAADLVICRAG